MRQYIDFETMNTEQRDAYKRILFIAREMLSVFDREYLFDIYCEAEDLWWEFFPFQASQYGDDWWVTKRFNDCDRHLKKVGNAVTVNLFGCNNVTVNVKNN